MTKESTNKIASVTGLALTGFALIVEPFTGVASLLARIAAFGAAAVDDNEVDKLGERTNSLEVRIAGLERAQIPTRRLSGDPLRLLACCLHRESTELFKYVEADEGIATLNISPREYREAAEELQALGLITINVNANHASGISRTCLKPVAFLSAAPALLLDVDLPGEIRKLFDVFRSTPEDQYLVAVSQILRLTGIPLPRLDLTLRALIDLGLLTEHGMASDEWGSCMDVRITPKGRRVLRGDDPLAA